MNPDKQNNKHNTDEVIIDDSELGFGLSDLLSYISSNFD